MAATSSVQTNTDVSQDTEEPLQPESLQTEVQPQTYGEYDDWEWFQALVREPSLVKMAATSSVQANTDASQDPGEPPQPDSLPTEIRPLKHPRYTKFDQQEDGQEAEDSAQYEPFRDSPIRAAFEALVVEWAVPDEQLQRASQVLLEHDFPILQDGVRSEFGYWDTGSLRHDLDGDGWMRVHLLPLSLVGFTLEETVEVFSTFVPKLRILTPLLPRYMLSLIRYLKKLRIGDSSRIRVEKDLLGFIGYHILRGPPTNPQQSEESRQKRLQDGVQFMLTWDWGNIEQDDLATAESLVLNCRQVSTITDVVEGDRVEEDFIENFVEEEHDSSWPTLEEAVCL
ncbi:hypothetical protein PoHVEF18_003821 [Penicillium ochrochloron]